jgi:vanillate O-demethylase monooxygenase subunit
MHEDPCPTLAQALDQVHANYFLSVERYGLVWTCLRPQAGEPLLPPIPSWGDPTYEPILPAFVDIAGSAGRQVEGFVDVAHFAFIYHDVFADRD